MDSLTCIDCLRQLHCLGAGAIPEIHDPLLLSVLPVALREFDISLTSQPPQDPEPFPMDMDSDMRYENENDSGFSQASTPSVGAPNPFWDSIDSFEHESASNKAYDKNDPLIRNLLK